MKEHGMHCFPPDYDILDMYIKHYHANLKKIVSHNNNIV